MTTTERGQQRQESQLELEERPSLNAWPTSARRACSSAPASHSSVMELSIASPRASYSLGVSWERARWEEVGWEEPPKERARCEDVTVVATIRQIALMALMIPKVTGHPVEPAMEPMIIPAMDNTQVMIVIALIARMVTFSLCEVACT